jgi:hypothetical protein
MTVLVVVTLSVDPVAKRSASHVRSVGKPGYPPKDAHGGEIVSLPLVPGQFLQFLQPEEVLPSAPAEGAPEGPHWKNAVHLYPLWEEVLRE